MKKYGLNLEIRIPGKIKMYMDLQKENKYDKEYMKNLEECLKKNFIYYKCNWFGNWSHIKNKGKFFPIEYIYY